MAVLLSAWLTAMCSYWLAHDITRDRWAATLAGVIVAGSPYMAAHMMGYFDLPAVWVLPLMAIGLRRALATGSAGWMAGCGLSIALAAYTAYYYVVYAAMLAVTYVASRVLVDRVALERRTMTLLTRRLIAASIALLVAVTVLIAWIATTGGVEWSIGGTRISMRTVWNPMTVGWLAIIAAVAPDPRAKGSAS